MESNSNRFELVDSDEGLNELCQALCSEKLALDTEFVEQIHFMVN